MSDADRLSAIQSDYENALEARITGLIANVQAAREITRQIQQAEGEVEMGNQEISSMEQELSMIASGTDEHEHGLMQIDAMRHAIRETEEIKGELIDALTSVVGELSG